MHCLTVSSRLFQRRRKRKKQEQVKQNDSGERVIITALLLAIHSTFAFWSE